MLRIFEREILNYESSLKHESKTIDGVSFTIRKPSGGRRGRLRVKLAEKSLRALEVMGEIQGIKRSIDAKEQYDAVQLKRSSAELDTIQEADIKPVWVRWGLKSIDGLDIDGQAATVDSLIEDGPEDLYEEIYRAIQKASGLTEVEAGESEPPSTSGAREAGKTSATTVEPVETKDSSLIETATE